MNQSLLKLIRYLWVILIAICLISYLFNPNLFSRIVIADYISQYDYAILIYLGIHIIRGFFLLPSTPLIFAGIIAFPSQPFTVLMISLFGILCSSLLIYFFSDKLGFSHFLSKHSRKATYLKQKLNGKYGFVYITGWAFFPFVPTDLICYLSGALKVNLAAFLISIFIGELVLCSIYIYGCAYLL